MSSAVWTMSLDELAKATGGRILSNIQDQFSGVTTDSRKPGQGCLFVAIHGDQFDGHDFCAAAVEQGVSVLLVHREDEVIKSLINKVSVVLVDDTTTGLQKLATYWREKANFKVVGITGSNGKTTTKEFTTTVLKSCYSVAATQGNLNNHWGVPLTILSAQAEHEVLILEMGMSHLGEIARLAQIAKPDVVLATNVGTSHIGEVGSQEGVRQAKKEIYEHSPGATAIFNRDNSFTRQIFEEYAEEHGREGTFSFSERDLGAEIDVSLNVKSANLLGMVVSGRVGEATGSFEIPISGPHNVSNLMAAASIGLALDVPVEKIWESLPKCRTAWGRNQIVEHPNGAQIIFDAYNANPQSMEALLHSLKSSSQKGQKTVVILGEMLELGDFSEQFHRKLGEWAGQSQAECIWFMGPHREAVADGVRSSGFQNKLVISDTYEESLAMEIESMLEPGDIVAIKGSRGMKLERVLNKWGVSGF
tara:strand:+ start:136981 stop:138408 length:1428 start_codon:yes stop_codon:yes gene_type:complete